MSEHGGHRERLRQRLREEGLEHFHDVNILELLLFYVMPRQDTNPAAHALLERFGSLAGVLDAREEELTQTEGIGENAALFLRLLPQIARRYFLEQDDLGEILATTDACGQYLTRCFIGKTEEEVYLLALDAKCKLLTCRQLQRGSLNTAGISVRKAVEASLSTKAVSVVLAHNHTSGIALPSRADLETTKKLWEALNAVGVLLADHIVVAGTDFVSMAEDGFFEKLKAEKEAMEAEKTDETRR